MEEGACAEHISLLAILAAGPVPHSKDVTMKKQHRSDKEIEGGQHVSD